MKKVYRIIIVLCLLISNVYCNSSLKRVPYIFDAGSSTSKLNVNSIKITPTFDYNIKTGYGWSINPIETFNNEKMQNTTMRNNLTIDGVVAKEVEFTIDLPQGEWWFTYWIDAGYDYNNSAKLLTNNIETTTYFKKIKPGESGIKKKMSLYKIYQSKVYVSNKGFKFKIIGVQDSIRLSGFSFIPILQNKDNNVDRETIKSLLINAGKYKSSLSLSDLNSYFKEILSTNPDNSYIAYWNQQVSILKESERIIEMMGWEWARSITRLSIFDRLKQALLLLDAILDNNDKENNYLREKALWYRGKIQYDLFLESGGKIRDEIAKSDLLELYRIYPDDPNLAMINGNKIDIPDPCDEMINSPNAPKWSILQRELYNRLSNEIDWWVNERQAANGEFGGKIGDDVELLRWWSSFLLTGHKNAIVGWKKVADAVWNNPKVYKGYSKKVYDVEHASEFISDSTPELILLDNDSIYFQHLNYTAEYFENLWTTINKNGHRYFKSAWYSSTEVDDAPPRNIDVDYNSRAVKPLRYLAWKTRNEHYIKLLHEWSIAWVDAAMSTKKNKPRGILPSSIRSTDESFNGDTPNWYQLNSYWNYFDWHYSVGSKILDNIMFTYILTKDENLLKPIELTLEMIEEFTIDNSEFGSINYEKGSKGWALQYIIKNKGFWNVVEKWAQFTNSNKYNNLLVNYGNDYTKYKLTKKISFLENNLENTLERIRYNTPLRTSLVLHTDRVRTVGANTLKAMLTGDGTSEASSPYYAITWENANKDFTALVKSFNTENISVDLFSHSDDKYEICSKLWLLEKGNYKLQVKDSIDNILEEKIIKINKHGEKVYFTLPSKELVNVKISQM